MMLVVVVVVVVVVIQVVGMGIVVVLGMDRHVIYLVLTTLPPTETLHHSTN